MVEKNRHEIGWKCIKTIFYSKTPFFRYSACSSSKYTIIFKHFGRNIPTTVIFGGFKTFLSDTYFKMYILLIIHIFKGTPLLKMILPDSQRYT